MTTSLPKTKAELLAALKRGETITLPDRTRGRNFVTLASGAVVLLRLDEKGKVLECQ